MGTLTITGAVLLLLPQTFLAENVISGRAIVSIAATQTHARLLHGAATERPLLLLPLLHRRSPILNQTKTPSPSGEDV